MRPSPAPITRRLATALATAGAAAFAVAGTLLLGSVAILLSPIPPRGRITFRIARLWARGLLACAGARVDARFETPLAAGRSYVFLANHQSYFDIPALIATLPTEVRFAAKRGLFRIPVFGWALSTGGFIPIDREDRSRAREAFAAAAERLRGGVSVFFFPEGSRTVDGRIGAFEKGGFLLALRAGLPIVPVGISGARGVMPRGRLKVSPGRIRLRYGAPVDPGAWGVRRRGELMDEVRRRIVELAGVPESDPPG